MLLPPQRVEQLDEQLVEHRVEQLDEHLTEQPEEQLDEQRVEQLDERAARRMPLLPSRMALTRSVSPGSNCMFPPVWKDAAAAGEEKSVEGADHVRTDAVTQYNRNRMACFTVDFRITRIREGASIF